MMDSQSYIINKEVKGDLVNLKEEMTTLKTDRCGEHQLCARRDQLESFQEQFETGKEEIVNSSRNQVTYVLDLLDTDECLKDTHSCSEMASCQDRLIKYNCTCHPGYFGDGFNCEDIDECSNATEICDTHETCINTDGSYYCACEEGYKRYGQYCRDFNECSGGAETCGSNSICINTIGSYTCTCEEGYRMNGNVCTDIDECAENKCHERASCDNSPGSYQCRCLSGYVGDGFHCEENHCEIPFIPVMELGCVFAIEERVTWDEAKDRCQASGSRPLEDVKEEHLDLLSFHFRNVSCCYWIGLGRDQIDEAFRWLSSGVPVPGSSPLWDAGMPRESRSARGENCGGLDLRPTSLGLYNHPCSYISYPLCQKMKE